MTILDRQNRLKLQCGKHLTREVITQPHYEMAKDFYAQIGQCVNLFRRLFTVFCVSNEIDESIHYFCVESSKSCPI